ncbi:neural Wiskott-Aldrich syndrome protein-like isoform X2 [Ischnura elegans]|nr:neural Wiskott-Aldrich syndrome protein-like isoform X2 [Ischnura elegans]
MNSRGTRLTAEDIGFPENFRHVLQIAWNDDGELEVINSMEPELEQLFQIGGITDGSAGNDSVREFLKHFLGKNDRMAAFRQKIRQTVENNSQSAPSEVAGASSAETLRSQNQADTEERPAQEDTTQETTSNRRRVRPAPPPPPKSPTAKEAQPVKTPVPAPRSVFTYSRYSPTSDSSDNGPAQNQQREESVYDVPKRLKIPETAVNPTNKEDTAEKMSDEEILNVLCDYISKRGGLETLKREVTTEQEYSGENQSHPNPAPRPSSLGDQDTRPQNRNTNGSDLIGSSVSSVSLDSVLK